MKTHHIRHMPVVENEKLIGLISLSDLQRVSFIDAYGKEGTEDTPIYNMLRHQRPDDQKSINSKSSNHHFGGVKITGK